MWRKYKIQYRQEDTEHKNVIRKKGANCDKIYIYDKKNYIKKRNNNVTKKDM